MQSPALEQWCSFLENNELTLRNAVVATIFPLLAGRILYLVHHYKSFRLVEPSSYNWNTSDDDRTVRSVTTYRHGEMATLFFDQKNISSSDFVSQWLELYQFDFQFLDGDWNQPCSWSTIIEDWLRTKTHGACIATTLENTISPVLLTALRQETTMEVDHENFWQSFLSNEPDGGCLSDLLFQSSDDLLEKAKTYTIAELSENFFWFYTAHKAQMDQERRKEERRQKALEERHQHYRVLAATLIPLFKQRLEKTYGVAVTRLRFAKDLHIWPMLWETLKTFSLQERRAILFVSDCSHSVREKYCKDF